MKPHPYLRVVGLLALSAGILWFFLRQIQRHWTDLSRVQLQVYWQYLLASLVLTITGYLIATLAWRKAIFLASGKELTFSESIGLVNIAQLTKYLPGKVWSYAIQMHLLSSHGISKTRVLSVGAIMQLSLVGSAAVIGFGYLAFAPTFLPHGVAVLTFAVLLGLYVFLVFGGTWSINLMVRVINATFKKNLATINVSLIGMVSVHGLNVISNVMFGIAGYLCAIGIGVHQDADLVIPIGASVLLSDTVGFLAFIAPGGIGVREGVMYTMLKSSVTIQMAFVLPVVFRLITTVSDLILGATALILLNAFSKDPKKKFNFQRRVP